MRTIFLLLVVCLFSPMVAQTPSEPVTPTEVQQTAPPEPTPPASEQRPPLPVDELRDFGPSADDQFTQNLLSMLATLGLLLAVVLMGTWFLKKFMNTRIQQINTTSEIKILEQRALTPKSSLYLLEIHGKNVVIAESVNGVSRIIDFTSDKENEDSEQVSRFGQILKEKMDQDKERS